MLCNDVMMPFFKAVPINEKNIFLVLFCFETSYGFQIRYLEASFIAGHPIPSVFIEPLFTITLQCKDRNAC
jgi:hypothetical protein